MPLILAKAATSAWLFGAATGRTPWSMNSEEAPPTTAGLWLGIGLVIVAIVLVSAGIRLHRRRQLRKISVLPDDPFAVEAMEAAVETFCELDPAWRRRDEKALQRLASGGLLSAWRPRLAGAPGDELLVEGPLQFEYMGAAAPGAGADRRAVVRVEGRLAGASKQISISHRQRGWLLGVAGVILITAFVGIALAPAAKLRNSRPATIVVRDGIPLRGTRFLTYRRGAWIDVTVRSDVADELYLQGYNVYRQLAPGVPAHLRLRASIEGAYPIVLEQRDETVAQVVVQP
jgi:hypothetical protein